MSTNITTMTTAQLRKRYRKVADQYNSYGFSIVKNNPQYEAIRLELVSISAELDRRAKAKSGGFDVMKSGGVTF